MKELKVIEPSRRQFITRVLPACSAMCLGAGKLFALTPSDSKSIIQQEKHMFDLEYPKKLSYKQFWAELYEEYIKLAKALEKEFGKEETIELLKKFTTERLLQHGKNQARGKSDLSLKAYTRQFKQVNYKNRLTIENIEDTDQAFELKVTECIYATTFLNAQAGDIGYAAVCWGDYAWAEGFNTKIILVRDKTLMQGHKICNHRYIWSG